MQQENLKSLKAELAERTSDREKDLKIKYFNDFLKIVTPKASKNDEN